MKIRFNILTLLATIAALAIPVKAAPDALSAWAGGGTDVGNTLCYTIVSQYSQNGGTPVITYLNATSDKAGSVVQFYKVAAQTTANYTNATVSLPVATTNSVYAASGIIVIRHQITDTYERRILDTPTSATNLTVTVAPTSAVIPGDQIYLVTTTGSIPVGNATKELNGPGIYAGQKMKPLLLEIDGTSACQLNAAAATYVP